MRLSENIITGTMFFNISKMTDKCVQYVFALRYAEYALHIFVMYVTITWLVICTQCTLIICYIIPLREVASFVLNVSQKVISVLPGF